MKTLVKSFLLAVVAVLFTSGCSSMGNSDSYGAGLNQPDVARNTSSGSIAGSPEASQ